MILWILPAEIPLSFDMASANLLYFLREAQLLQIVATNKLMIFSSTSSHVFDHPNPFFLIMDCQDMSNIMEKGAKNQLVI
jgi:hypothetical protein